MGFWRWDSDAVDPAGVITFRRSRWRVLPFLAGYLVFALVGGGMFAFGLQQKAAGASIFAFVFAAVILALGVAGLVAFGPDAVSPREILWITDEGFGQRLVHPHVFVPWSELLEVSLVTRGSTKTVAVKVGNPTLLSRRWVRNNTRLGKRRYRWAIKAVTLMLVAIGDAVSPWNLPHDLLAAVNDDFRPHGDFEIGTAAFPIKAQQLVALLREQQLEHAGTPHAVA